VNTRWVYLLHLDRPLGNPANRTGQANHYLGSAWDVAARQLAETSSSCDVKMLQAAQRAGIGWRVVRVWPGDRKLERRLKDRGGASRLCPACGIIPAGTWWETDDMNEMRGGWSVVAAVINQNYRPQPPVSRAQVAAWYNRQTLNRAGHAPPEPVLTVEHPKRTQPRWVFRLADWVEWYRPGVPRRGGNQHRSGWVTWAQQELPRATEDVEPLAEVV
jgi:hypothetical protein